MPRTDENILRRKLSAAYAAGKGSEERALTEMFGVSLDWWRKFSGSIGGHNTRNVSDSGIVL